MSVEDNEQLDLLSLGPCRMAAISLVEFWPFEEHQTCGTWTGSWHSDGRRLASRLRQSRILRHGSHVVVVQVFTQFPAARSAVKAIHLVETSDAMQKTQDGKLRPTVQTNGWDLLWHNTLDEVPCDEGIYTMILAHEFFDALPFHLLEVCVLS